MEAVKEIPAITQLIQKPTLELVNLSKTNDKATEIIKQNQKIINQ